MPDSPSPRAGVSIALRNGAQFLFIRRAKPPLAGTWSLPGGGCRWGETLWQTAHRELYEETGLIGRPIRVLTTTDSIFQQGTTIQSHWHITTVLMAWQEGTPQASSDAEKASWMTIPQALAKIRWMPLRGVLRDLQKLRDHDLSPPP